MVLHSMHSLWRCIVWLDRRDLWQVLVLQPLSIFAIVRKDTTPHKVMTLSVTRLWPCTKGWFCVYKWDTSTERLIIKPFSFSISRTTFLDLISIPTKTTCHSPHNGTNTFLFPCLCFCSWIYAKFHDFSSQKN